MIKFQRPLDIQKFLIEIGKVDLALDVPENYTPSEAEFDTFIQARKPLIKKMRDFRRSIAAQNAWTQHRDSIMRGINKFHTSTHGKAFHRRLGTFLATRLHRGDAGGSSGSDEGWSIYELGEVLKAVNSAKTHAYVEMEYYKSIDEDLDYWSFLEWLFEPMRQIEIKVYDENCRVITPEEWDILIRLVEPSAIVNSIAELTGVSRQESDRDFSKQLWEKAAQQVRSTSNKGPEDQDFHPLLIDELRKILKAESSARLVRLRKS
jgi:hypothetical protein